MSEAKFTKGPWEVFIDDCGDKWTGWPISINAPNIHEDCMVVRTGGQWPYEWDFAISQREAVANAHLIAAAPELYAFVEKVRDFARELGDEGLYEDADTALAKARGEV